VAQKNSAKHQQPGKAKLVTKLEKCFPSKQISRSGVTVTVRPLTLSQIPVVVDSFVRVVGLKTSGKNDQEVIVEAIDDILKMVQLTCDVPMAEIPMALAPEIALTFLQQNLSSDVLGNWVALIGEVTGVLQGIEPLQKPYQGS
jgi:hypothetical protein